MLIQQLSPIDGHLALDPECAIMETARLPWYDSVSLLRVKDATWAREKLVVFYLRTQEGALNRLDGTSLPIHAINASEPIRLNDSNVIDYLRFFCFFVRGEEGPFYLLERPDDLALPIDMDPTTTRAIKELARPAQMGKNNEGQYLCNAVVLYSNLIFTASFGVRPAGTVEMFDDEPIAKLPLRLDLGVLVTSDEKSG
jgi:hypothetical protein